MGTVAIYKTVPTGSGHQSMGRGRYRPGLTVTASDPDGHDAWHASWLWGCATLDVAMQRARSLYRSDPALCDIFELAVDEDTRLESGARLAGASGYVRFKRCTVVRRVFGTGATIPDDTTFLPPRLARLERVANVRATAILAGRRTLAHEGDDEIGRLVHQKVATANTLPLAGG